MTRGKQEFYFFLKMLDWLFCNTSKECQFLTRQESDIYFEGVIKLRGLHVKLKKEYERMIKEECERMIKEECEQSLNCKLKNEYKEIIKDEEKRKN